MSRVQPELAIFNTAPDDTACHLSPPAANLDSLTSPTRHNGQASDSARERHRNKSKADRSGTPPQPGASPGNEEPQPKATRGYLPESILEVPLSECKNKAGDYLFSRVFAISMGEQAKITDAMSIINHNKVKVAHLKAIYKLRTGKDYDRALGWSRRSVIGVLEKCGFAYDTAAESEEREAAKTKKRLRTKVLRSVLPMRKQRERERRRSKKLASGEATPARVFVPPARRREILAERRSKEREAKEAEPTEKQETKQTWQKESEKKAEKDQTGDFDDEDVPELTHSDAEDGDWDLEEDVFELDVDAAASGSSFKDGAPLKDVNTDACVRASSGSASASGNSNGVVLNKVAASGGGGSDGGGESKRRQPVQQWNTTQARHAMAATTAAFEQPRRSGRLRAQAAAEATAAEDDEIEQEFDADTVEIVRDYVENCDFTPRLDPQKATLIEIEMAGVSRKEFNAWRMWPAARLLKDLTILKNSSAKDASACKNFRVKSKHLSKIAGKTVQFFCKIEDRLNNEVATHLAIDSLVPDDVVPLVIAIPTTQTDEHGESEEIEWLLFLQLISGSAGEALMVGHGPDLASAIEHRKDWLNGGKGIPFPVEVFLCEWTLVAGRVLLLLWTRGYFMMDVKPQNFTQGPYTSRRTRFIDLNVRSIHESGVVEMYTSAYLPWALLRGGAKPSELHIVYILAFITIEGITLLTPVELLGLADASDCDALLALERDLLKVYRSLIGNYRVEPVIAALLTHCLSQNCEVSLTAFLQHIEGFLGHKQKDRNLSDQLRNIHEEMESKLVEENAKNAAEEQLAKDHDDIQTLKAEVKELKANRNKSNQVSHADQDLIAKLKRENLSLKRKVARLEKTIDKLDGGQKGAGGNKGGKKGNKAKK